jgi:hypothetical protein
MKIRGAVCDRLIEIFLAFMLVVTVSQLGGCSTTTTVRVGVEYCEHAAPIWFDSAHQVDLTPSEILRRIVEHNETYSALCNKQN